MPQKFCCRLPLFDNLPRLAHRAPINQLSAKTPQAHCTVRLDRAHFHAPRNCPAGGLHALGFAPTCGPGNHRRGPTGFSAEPRPPGDSAVRHGARSASADSQARPAPAMALTPVRLTAPWAARSPPNISASAPCSDRDCVSHKARL